MKDSDLAVAESGRVQVLLTALREIEQMSRSASQGPAHVAKLSLSMMAGVAAEAIAKAEGRLE